MLKQALTLEALQVLDAIDRKGSFAAAANILYKVPSAITYSVQKLEQDLGVTLFIKRGRKSVLTPAGKALVEQGRELLSAAERLTETARQIDRGWESSVDIVVDTSLGSNHIYPLLDDFFKLKPDIEINLHQEALAGGWDALIENRADIAVGLPKKPSEISGFCSEPYTTIQWVFAVNANHPLADQQQPVDKKDIECYRAVVVRDSSRNNAKITHRVFSKRPLLSVQTLDDKINAQKAGLGVGFLPKAKIEPELASGELRQINIAGVKTSTTLYLGWRRYQTGKALKWFIDKLKQPHPQ